MSKREKPFIHPGEVLEEDVLTEFGMSAKQLGEVLGVPSNRITEIVRGRRGISADTALRLSRWLGTTPKFWLILQQAYDLEVAIKEHGEEIDRTVMPRSVA